MKKNMKKLVVVAADFCSQALFVVAVTDLVAACKERTESPALRTLLDIGGGVAVGLHAAYRGGLLDSRLSRIEAEPDPDPAPAAEASPDPDDDWTGDEAPFVEEE